jgi:RNA polymerase sigma factor (sigma-70 family)
MRDSQLDSVLRQIRALTAARQSSGLADRELLERFVAQHDEDAFAAIVERHGGLVLGVCRRVLHNEHDAQDACQATFLVLARKAGGIRKRDSLASWLYGVAGRTSRKLYADVRRRSCVDLKAAEVGGPDTTQAISWQEGLRVLDEELTRLPGAYRNALVLCYLQGRRQDEAARELGCSLGALCGRLVRARECLRKRLARRGVALPSAVVGTLLVSTQVTAGLPPVLCIKTVQAACKILGGQALAQAVPAHLATLTEGVLSAMLITRVSLMATVAIAATLLVAGAGALTGAAWSGPAAAPWPDAVTVAAAIDAQEKAADKPPAMSMEREALEQALQAANDVQDVAQKARIILLVARVQAGAGDREAARQNLQRASQIASALPNDKIGDFYRRTVISSISETQAEVGDLTGALKTLAAYGKPGDFASEDMNLQDWVNGAITFARVRIACALARAGNDKAAAETVREIESSQSHGYMKWPVLVEAATAQARAGNWIQARETAKSIQPEAEQIAALTAIARLQAEAGLSTEARDRLAEALTAVPREQVGDGPVQYRRATLLQGIALASADVGDPKTATATAELIPDLPMFVNVQYPQVRNITLATLRARAGDIAGAKDLVRDVIGVGADFHRLIARSQAQAKDVKGGLETADAIDSAVHRTFAYLEIAQAQFRAADRDGAAKTFAKALESAEAVPEAPGAGDGPGNEHIFRLGLLQVIASAQAEAGAKAEVQAWIARQPSATLKACALVGLAEGIAKREAATQKGKAP